MGEGSPVERVRGFVAELRRRRVFRVLVAYLIVGISVAEAADLFFPGLGLPDWTVQLVLVLVSLGLPVAVGLAWAFDVVPDTRARHGAAVRPAAADAPDPVTPSPAARWVAVQDLFHRASELPDAEREGFLRRASGGDEELAREVRSLLDAHAEAEALDDLQHRVLGPILDQAKAVEALEGEQVLQYRIEERLGGGGMGVVYKAHDTKLDRTVTLKFLSGHLLSDRTAKERFLVEAQAAAALDHPNLCTIHEIGEAGDGRLFIAMTYYEGETLQRRIGRGRVEAREALGLVAQICRGLSRAGEKGIVHRDIKPSNVIVTTDGTAKIVDFGLAKMERRALTRSGARMGTIAYMSPEQTRGDPVDQRTDVWSVGVVLYEMLRGARPFRGGSDQAVIHAILNEDPEPLDSGDAGVAPGVARIVARALEKEPARRYADAAALLSDVERLIADPDGLGSIESTPSLPPEGERRLVTVLASAIGGFEELLDSLRPDEVDRRLASLRARVQRVIEDYGGVLNDFSEDRLVALFGVPVTHEDDPLRAVRAALEIHGAAEAGVELRSAVGSGQVAIQATEAGERLYRVGGSVVREVTRLAIAAASGEILLSPDLSRAVVPFVETEERAPVPLTAGREPVTPLAVIGASEADSRLDASLPGTLSRFVGRQDELSALERALDATRSGTGRLVSVVGDAGVGKSRLLHEFRASLADVGVRHVQGRCQAQGSLTPFLPFIECARSRLGAGGGAPEEVHDQVVRGVRALSDDLEVYIPMLLHLLSIDSEEHPVPEYLTGEDLRGAVAEALVSLFTTGYAGEPLVLLLEDWHWVDGGSEDVLRQLAEMASTHPLLLVVTARPESEHGRPTVRGQTHLELAPLGPTTALEVMKAALGASIVPPELADAMGEKTGGNPFFIEELCHTLLEAGTISVEGGEARPVGSLDRLAIPDTVQAVLKTRLDRLDPEAREVLRSASVVGRRFGHGLLARVVPSEQRLDAALDTLRAAGLIQRTSLVPEPTYRFKHALTLDVTYDSLLERQRRERHALVGRAIEELYAGRLEEHCERLATHFAGAEDWDRAVPYGFAAAERAASLWRTAEAVETLERTRVWIEAREQSEEQRRATMTQLLLSQERHYETLSRRDRQKAVIDELLELIPPEPSPQRATVLVREGELYTLLGRHAEAERAFDAAIEAAEAVGAEEERIMALRGIGHRFWRLGMYTEALAPLREVVEHDRVSAPRTVLLRDLVNLGRMYRERGEWAEAQAIGDEAQAIAESSTNVVDQAYALNYKGHLLRAMGRLAEAAEAFEVGSRTAIDAHLYMRGSFTLLSLAAVHMEMGRIDAALEAYDEAVGLSRRANGAEHLAHALSLQGDAMMTIGSHAEARRCYEEAVGILAGLSSQGPLSEALGKLAGALEADGHPEAASTWRRAKELRLAAGDTAGALDAAEREARLEGDPERSRRLYDEALRLALQADDPAAEARIRNSIAILDWQSGALEAASRQYEGAADALRRTTRADGLGAVLNGWGTVLSRLGRHDEARSVLEEALTTNRAEGAAEREADSLSALGGSCAAAKDLARAYDWYQQCLEMRRATGDRVGEGWALHRLAELSVAADAPERARAFRSEALAIAGETGDAELLTLCTEASDTEDSSAAH